MLGRLRHAIDAVIARGRFERDMRDELRLHIEHRADDLVESGMSRDDAVRQARIEFGGIEKYKEQCRDERGFAAVWPLQGVAMDVRLAARRLLATPQFLIFAVVSLGVGIGVTTAAYSLLQAIVRKPIVVSDPSRLVFLTTPGYAGRYIWQAVVSRPDFEDLRASQTSFSAIAGSVPFSQTFAGPSASEILDGEAVSNNYFETLGLSASVGRTIRADDDPSVVILSHRLWRKQFDANPAVLGRTVKIAGLSFEVIGVAPRSFEGLQNYSRTNFWVPLEASTRFSGWAHVSVDDRARRQVSVVGRLPRDEAVSRAATELATISGRLDAAFPLSTARGVNAVQTVTPRRWSARAVNDPDEGSRESMIMPLLLGMVGLVLVVACTNLANLMLARGAERQQEFAIRRALGASRWRLVRELCVESALVAGGGGLLAFVVIRVLLALATVDLPLPRGSFSLEPTLNLEALLVASAALLVSMFVFGLEPALQLTKPSITGDLAGGTGTVGLPRSERQRAFIRWQVAISASFFLVAAILAKVVVAEARHDPGVDVDRLAIASVHFSLLGWDEARARRVLGTAADQLRQERSIESVTVSSGVPFGMILTPYALATTPDRPFLPGEKGHDAFFIAATPEIFRTLGVPILRGRGFTDRDGAAAPAVTVVSESIARTLFGTTEAIGRQIMIQVWGRPPSKTFFIVGVARDTDSQTLMSREDGTVYVPFAQHYEPNLTVVVRTSDSPTAVARVVQSALRRADPDLGTWAAGPGWILLTGAYLVARIAAALATTLGMLTLILAMVGLYGVQSHIVAQRTREVGVRMALGASAPQIERMVLGEGFRPVVEGLVLGAVFGIIMRLGVRAILHASIQPFDPISFALVPIPLVVAAFVACYVPARRAARVDPNTALRHL